MTWESRKRTGVPVSDVSEPACMKPGPGTQKSNAAVINIINYTYAFPAMTGPSVKGAFLLRSPKLKKMLLPHHSSKVYPRGFNWS